MSVLEVELKSEGKFAVMFNYCGVALRSVYVTMLGLNVKGKDW